MLDRDTGQSPEPETASSPPGALDAFIASDLATSGFVESPFAETGPTTSAQLGLGPEQPFTVADRVGLAAERLDELRERPFLIGSVLLAILALALTLPGLLGSDVGGPPIEDRIPRVTLTPTSVIVGTTTVFVHVSGAVRVPGVYTLDATARVVDAVEAAGGATAEAELHQLNLAALVVDGQQIRVPVEGEVVTSFAPAVDGPIDLNRADVVALQELPGVGPATAEAIVAYRDDNGPFQSVDDILDVPGIGPAKLAAIADAAIVR